METPNLLQIPDVPEVMPECDLLGHYPDLPDPASSLFLTVTRQQNADGSENHLISGVRVVFDGADDANGLFRRYHRDPGTHRLPDEPAPDGTIRNLTICADELVVSGELWLPETHVAIFARKLVFKRRDGKHGRIVTSPLAHANEKAGQQADGTGVDGRPGRKAGNIDVCLRHLETDDPFLNRFCLRGGKGQDPGPGQDGADGKSLEPAQVWPSLVFSVKFLFGNTASLTYAFDPVAAYVDLDCCAGGPHGASDPHVYYLQNQIVPTSGEDAKPAGAPGEGGDGGTFTGVLPAWAVEAVQASVSPQDLAAAADKAEEAQAFMAAALEGLAPLEASGDGFNLAIWLPAVERVEKALIPAVAAIRAARDAAGEAGPAPAGMFAEVTHTVEAALRKTRYFSDGTIPLQGEHEHRIKANLRQISLCLQMAREKAAAAVANLPGAGGMVDTSGGAAGLPERTCRGGRKGWPDKCAHWKIVCFTNVFAGLHRHSQKVTKTIVTEDGEDALPGTVEKKRGAAGACEVKRVEEFGDAWLHPALVQTFLLYVRDAYLAAPDQIEALTPVLKEYAAALQALPPAAAFGPLIERTGMAFHEPLYLQSLAEVATLLHRIESRLDYFGNPAGWTPLFSLPVCLKLYEEEVNEGLKALLLARWIQERADREAEAAAVAGQSIASLNRETGKMLAQIEDGKDTLKRLREQAEALEQEITRFRVKLETKRTELLTEAEAQARDAAWIHLGVSVLSGLCQVVPYGQPALGALGSAGQVIADHLVTAEDPVRMAGPLSSLLADFTKAELDGKAAKILAAAKEAPKDPKAEAAAATAGRLTQVGKAVGPALAGITGAVAGLNVPRSEVDARLRKLEAESPAFQALVEDLEALNGQKAEFLQKLSDGLQSLSTAYARVTANLLAAGSMARRERESLSVLDHEALLYARGMDQGARLMLDKYLYYLAKCYEYAVLEPIQVNFQLAAILDKITSLLAGRDLDGDVARLAGELAPLFTSELRRIEDKLKENFRQESTEPLEIRLSRDQTPAILSRLNQRGEAVIHLRDFNCIPPGWERIRIAGISVEGLEFETDGQPAPPSGSIEIRVEPSGTGTMRAGNRLYVVRHPTSSTSANPGQDSRQSWGMTYHFGSGQKEAIRPSRASLELLDFLLGDTDKSIQEKIASPAAWTGLKVRYTRYVQAPELKSVILKLDFTWSRADDDYCVLDVRMDGRQCPLLKCSPGDTNGRGDGWGSLYRIYPRGTQVRLSAPPRYGNQAFTHWEVIDTNAMKLEKRVEGTVLAIDRMDHHLLVFCHYEYREAPHVVVHEQSGRVRDFVAAQFTRLPGEREIADFLGSEAFARFQAGLPELRAGDEGDAREEGGGGICNRPAGFPVGYLPPQAAVTELEETRDAEGARWRKVDFRGTVGWVKGAAAIPEATVPARN